jgi:tRNA-2-methylthio-N6-dimethylallyladenosine synthase
VDVLVEGPSKRNASRWSGRSPEYRVVNFTGRATPGVIRPVKITAASAFSLRGEAVIS